MFSTHIHSTPVSTSIFANPNTMIPINSIIIDSQMISMLFKPENIEVYNTNRLIKPINKPIKLGLLVSSENLGPLSDDKLKEVIKESRINENGILEILPPIKVVEYKSGGKIYYEIVDGRHRVVSALILNKSTINAKIIAKIDQSEDFRT